MKTHQKVRTTNGKYFHQLVNKKKKKEVESTNLGSLLACHNGAKEIVRTPRAIYLMVVNLEQFIVFASSKNCVLIFQNVPIKVKVYLSCVKVTC